jgi:CspA family cold shock protein
MSDRKIGTVKWFNGTKGYGFIVPEAGGPDVFVHINAIQKSGLQGLKENDRVSYELFENGGKESAGDLELIK